PVTGANRSALFAAPKGIDCPLMAATSVRNPVGTPHALVMLSSRVGNAESGVAALSAEVFTGNAVKDGRARDDPGWSDGATDRRRDHRRRRQDNGRGDLEQDLPGLARLQCDGCP